MNHLASESSPYLLQHRDNPVDWYPWGDEALEKAKDENRPVFLSIGYATCHWCHVMEHESFANEEVAALMNRWFVSIKVDREERPDIDHVYMSVCQLMGGHCGWPLNVVLTPDRKPFFVATYIPRTSRYGRVGMMDLLPRIAEAWETRRASVTDSAEEITQALRSLSDRLQGGEFDPGWLRAARDQFGARHDPVHGGFSEAPKFPSPHNLLFLLRYAARSGDAEAIGWVSRTLRSMRLGGIFDQVGYGFHRYSTDASWKLPHFEKMLYDQALHIMAYTEGFLATGEPLFRSTALQVAEYVLRVLAAKEGGFYSAEDADSEGEEGKFYVWSADEMSELLGPQVGDRVRSTLHVRPEGNFREEASGRTTGENVLFLDEAGVAFAAGTDPQLEGARQVLFQVREARPRPLLDDKILADWNGLMIAALASCGRALGEGTLVDSAAAAARFIREVMYDESEGLSHRFRNGDVGVHGNLDDYAFLSWGMTELYQATLDAADLEWALKLTDQSIDRFLDHARGGFFLTLGDRSDLLVRPRDFNDGAVPSGNAVALLNLVRLGRLCGRPSFDKIASELLGAAAPLISRYPSAFAGLLLGVEFLQSPSETILVGTRDHPVIRAMYRRLCTSYLPGNVVVGADPSDPAIRELAPYVSSFPEHADGPRAFVCRDYVCAEPASSPDDMMRRFSELA